MSIKSDRCQFHTSPTFLTPLRTSLVLSLRSQKSSNAAAVRSGASCDRTSPQFSPDSVSPTHNHRQAYLLHAMPKLWEDL